MNYTFSILIPVFNFDVSNLVNFLHSQANQISSEFEILLIDDKSDSKFINLNKNLNNLEKVNFQYLKQNIGRSKIRNLLFHKAKYEKCIIMDCDISIDNNFFLEKYLNSLKNNIVVGGHKYHNNPPTDKKKYTHWLYGSKVEVKSLNIRIKHPYQSFMTNCFATTKTIFKKIKFEEQLSKYGHEDTIFGFELKKHKVDINHIDNPVTHIGLNDENAFFVNQENALNNLAFLYTQSTYRDKLNQLKLIKVYNSVLNKFPLIIVLDILHYILKFTYSLNDNFKLFYINTWKLKTFSNYMKNRKIFTYF